MESTMYVQSIDLVPGDEWYKGLEVTIVARLGCFDIPCEYCKAALHVGLSSSTSLVCGYIPDDYKHFDRRYVDLVCGSEEDFTFKHVVTQADIDAIESGARRCCAYIAGGLSGMCYEYDSVKVVEPEPDPDPGKGKITRCVAEPTKGNPGDRIYIYTSIKNTGQTRCLLKLEAVEGSNKITDSGGFGWVDPGQPIENIMMQFSMLDHTMNITVNVIRSE